MKLLLTALCIGGCLLGQNKPSSVKTSQVTGVTATQPQILIVTPNGRLRETTIESTLKVTCNPTFTICSIGAVAPPASSLPRRRIDTTTVTVPTVFTFRLALVPDFGEVDVLRNGIELTEGSDYTRSGEVITFLPGAEPTQGDVILVKSR